MANGSLAEIDRAATLDLIRAGAQLVEVLSEKQYKKTHLVGASHIPLEALDQDAVAVLKRDEPVIVYCYDNQ